MEENDGVITDVFAFLEELYVSKCKDTLEKPTREEYLRFSSKLK